MIEDHGPLVICTLAGALDAGAVATAERGLSRLDLRSATTLTVDLTGLDSCDTTGVDWLLALRDRAARSETYLLIIVGPGHVERLLRVTDLDRHLNLAELQTAAERRRWPPRALLPTPECA